MLTSDFRSTVLLDPIGQGANRLKIVAGYATHMESTQVKFFG